MGRRLFYSVSLLIIVLFPLLQGGLASTFTIVNKCDFTIWPGVLGTPPVDTTGFELKKGGSRSLQAPAGWSGRLWGRTGCSFDSTGQGTCATADCGSNQIKCNGATAKPPATLAEFTLGSGGSLDYYDVSLVDGYNLPMIVEAKGGSTGGCSTTGCVDDINQKCPNELRVDGGAACKSACDAFGKAEYCCAGAFASPATCKPSAYSQIFKSSCPKAYSYAYDDATSTFTCSASGYTVTFCPNSPSLKSASDSPPDKARTVGAAMGSDDNNFPVAWMADMATGGSRSSSPRSSIVFIFLIIFVTVIADIHLLLV